MDWIDKNVTVSMVREDLNSLPQCRLPDGFHLTWFKPGDEQSWVTINSLADRYNTIDAKLFAHEFGRDARQLRDRQCFLCDAEGARIGTATAWFDDNFRGQAWGRIHWVAIVPSCQGRGLANPLLSAACNRLRELGHQRAYLYTSSARLPAINLYKKFGFIPDIQTGEDIEIWQVINERLGQPA